MIGIVPHHVSGGDRVIGIVPYHGSGVDRVIGIVPYHVSGGDRVIGIVPYHVSGDRVIGIEPYHVSGAQICFLISDCPELYYTLKVLNFRTPKMFGVGTLKFKQRGFTIV